MYAYPVTLTPDTNGEVLVDFQDIPWAHSAGDDEEMALLNAVDGLITAFNAYIERREPIPEPSEPKQGQPVVIVPVVIAAKAALHNSMRPPECARRTWPDA